MIITEVVEIQKKLKYSCYFYIQVNICQYKLLMFFTFHDTILFPLITWEKYKKNQTKKKTDKIDRQAR